MTRLDTQSITRATRDSIAAVPGAPLSFQIAARAVLHLTSGRLRVTTPDGTTLVFDSEQPGPDAQLTIRDWRGPKRVLTGGNLGFAESYMAGMWDSEDISVVLDLFSRNFEDLGQFLRGKPLAQIAHWAYHVLRRNTRAGAKKNIYAHYDLGNEFYELWLDETMTYSSALFASPTDELAMAQRNKYTALADSLDVTETSHVLEIGSGWGGFAEYVAQERGAKVTGLTISREQYDFARQRLFERQLNHKVDIRLCDYRDVEGQYDGVASIEMFEAVGEKYWPGYFEKVHQVLKPGRPACLQIITVDDNLFDIYRKRVDFIQRYVFPGGMLPSPSKLKTLAGHAGFDWRSARTFGQDYAETLKRWRDKFSSAWNEIRAMNAKFDERFRRLWTYYLAYCEAGFRTGRIDVGQFTLQRST